MLIKRDFETNQKQLRIFDRKIYKIKVDIPIEIYYSHKLFLLYIAIFKKIMSLPKIQEERIYIIYYIKIISTINICPINPHFR